MEANRMGICEGIVELVKSNLLEILALRNNKALKDDGSYVSEGDLFSERIIFNYLLDHYPEYAIISEEAAENNLKNWSQDKVVVVDPIDGTENYVSGLKEWGIAVSVYESGKHVQSLLALPELDIYYLSGTFLPRYESRIIGLSSSLSKDDLGLIESGFEYRITGCCVYNMYNVLTGSFCSFENFKGAKMWDILPGLNMALQEGMLVIVNNQYYNGELLRPDQKYTFRIRQK